MRTLLAVLLLTAAPVVTQAAINNRTSSATQTVAINGSDCPEVISWSGGDISGTVAETNLGNSSPKKHISQVRYEPIVIKVVPPLSSAMSSCLSDLCAGRTSTLSLELTGSDPRPLQATNASLVEAQFPALNGSNRDSYEITLIFTADSVRPTTTTSTRLRAATRTTRATASNFAFTLGALETNRVASIEPFTISRRVSSETSGVFRENQSQLTAPKFSNLSVIVSDVGAASWTAWRDDFLVNGNRTDANELNGTLTLLSADMSTALLKLQLSHVGLLRFAHNIDSASETIARSTATLYCEQITLDPATASTPTPAPSTTKPTTTPAPNIPTKATSSSADTGLRDPAGFPRPEGLTRTSYTKVDTDNQLNETAEYTASQNVDATVEAYVKSLTEAGWKRESFKESGNTPADQLVMSNWRKDKSQADLRFYGAKTGCKVYLSMTTAKNAKN